MKSIVWFIFFQVETVSHYLLGKSAKDQMFLVMHESKRADLLYCLLLDTNLSGAPGGDPENHLRLNFLTLLSILLKTNKVSARHKGRMNLHEAGGYLGFLHLRFKMVSTPIDVNEACLLFDQMILFDDPTAYQGILGKTIYWP